ncbi:MAG TPA: lycopene cyclase domain-containing protein [Candidatus Nanoarchaeia archaeon]|nr:lycopene cyclase domain-containing protein [Candidatus Nanoarchaeia archaeon]
MEYFLILILLLLIAIFLEYKFRIHIYHSRKERIITSITFFIIGILWDYFATWRQNWNFPGPGLIGIRILDLPIEEFIFFLIIPYFILTLYKVYDKKIK